MRTIDIKDINYIAFTLGVSYKNNTGSKLALKLGRSWFYGISSFIYHFFYYFIKGPWFYPSYKGDKYDTLYFGISLNNENALNNIEVFDSTKYLVINKKRYPFVKAYVHSLLYVGEFLRVVKNSNSNERKIIKANFLDFVLAYGNYCVCVKLLKRIGPHIVVIANDHSVENVCLIRACSEEHIQTLYVQHASVTNNFPPLCVDYAFLDGQESFEKYFNIGGLKSKCFITGAVRFDGIHIKTVSNKVNIVGVAINQFDSNDKITYLISVLKENDYNVVLRPHPAMDMSYYQAFCCKTGIGFSNPRLEKSYDFLTRIDCLVSNQSSIHLDANIVHCASVCYNMSDSIMDDYYGYSKKGLIRVFDKIDNLIDTLKSNDILKEYHEDIVRYYNASTGTMYEGKVGLLIADFIHDIVNKGHIKDFVNNYNLIYDSSFNKYEYSPVALLINESDNKCR